MKVVLDLSDLVARGLLEAAEAERLKALAAKPEALRGPPITLVPHGSPRYKRRDHRRMPKGRMSECSAAW